MQRDVYEKNPVDPDIIRKLKELMNEAEKLNDHHAKRNPFFFRKFKNEQTDFMP